MGIFSCLSAGSISTLSFPKCDLFCSSSLQHNHAVFIVCGERGREGARGRQKKVRGMNGTRGQNKNKWRKRPNVSVSPLSSSLLSLLLITCHIAQPCPSILPSFFSVFFLISLSFSLSSRNFRPHFIHQPMVCY